MNSWRECEEGMTVYMKESVRLVTENGVRETGEYAEAHIEYINGNEIIVKVNKKIFKDEEFYFYTDRDSPSELLTKREYIELKTNNNRLWRDLKGILSRINEFNYKTSEINKLADLIERNVG